jgi:hypothetical protein
VRKVKADGYVAKFELNELSSVIQEVLDRSASHITGRWSVDKKSCPGHCWQNNSQRFFRYKKPPRRFFIIEALHQRFRQLHERNQRLRIDTEDQHQQCRSAPQHHRRCTASYRRITVELLRRAQVQAHGDAQVVVETNRGADNHGRRQPPQVCLHPLPARRTYR